MRILSSRRQLSRPSHPRRNGPGEGQARPGPGPTTGAGGGPPIGAGLVAFFFMTIVWFCATASIIYRRSFPDYDYVPGQLVDANVYSEVEFQYEDPFETRLLREQAALQVPLLFRVDRFRIDQAMHVLNEAMQVLTRSREPKVREPLAEEPSAGIEAKLRALSAECRSALEFLASSPDRRKLLEGLVVDALRRGIAREEDMLPRPEAGGPTPASVCLVDEHDRKSVCDVRNLQTPASAARNVAEALVTVFPENSRLQRDALEALLPHVLLPNLVIDEKATSAARATAAGSVAPVRKVVHPDTLLLRRGSKVSKDDLNRLAEHQKELQNVRRRHENARDMAVFAGLCLLLVLALAQALHVVRPDLRSQPATIALLGLVLVLQIALSRLVGDVYYRYWISKINLFPLLPLTFGPMLLSQMVGIRLAIAVAALTSTVAALQNTFSLDLLLIGVISSTVAAVCVRRARRRVDVLRTGLAVGLTVFATDSLLLIRNGVPNEVLPWIGGLALLNGTLVAVLVSTLMPGFEYVFGLTTDMSLVELNDLNHPLLRRLQLEAPGTYHHSLMVATLAEAAAGAVGANALLARVCAYFHDIGKLSNPEYFAENLTGQNPHDELDPQASSVVILNHVKSGLELAFRYKLKRVIREAIVEHHGTSLVYYFYRRALDQAQSVPAGTKAIGERDYRYPGPPPWRKEIALISIADSCEAAVRALEKPTPQQIKALVDEIVLNRIRDGQLDRANLTFHELAVARETITQTLVTMLHGRVKYPREDRHDSHPGKDAPPAPTPPTSPAAAGNPAGPDGDRPGPAGGAPPEPDSPPGEPGGKP